MKNSNSTLIFIQSQFVITQNMLLLFVWSHVIVSKLKNTRNIAFIFSKTLKCFFESRLKQKPFDVFSHALCKNIQLTEFKCGTPVQLTFFSFLKNVSL